MLCVPFGNSLKILAWLLCEVRDAACSFDMCDAGTISSCWPLRKSMGTEVILGIVSSLGQIWWQR